MDLRLSYVRKKTEEWAKNYLCDQNFLPCLRWGMTRLRNKSAPLILFPEWFYLSSQWMTQVHAVILCKRSQVQGRKICIQFTHQNGVRGAAGAFVWTKLETSLGHTVYTWCGAVQSYQVIMLEVGRNSSRALPLLLKYNIAGSQNQRVLLWRYCTGTEQKDYACPKEPITSV